MALVILSFILALLLSTASACDRCLHQSKATSTQISSGSCSYGSLAMDFNGGFLAAGLPSLFKKGAGCGACFKVRCTNHALCKREGTPIILSELHGDNRTDLVLSQSAFSAMANEGASQTLLNLGIVDIEYKRVPCDYENKNLAIQVENYSSKPYYLAILILYQGGQTEIVAVDVAQVGSTYWTSMKRNHGAVWDTNNVPPGPLQFRFLVTSGYDGKYVWSPQVLPYDWKNGVIYDAHVQISDLAQESCYPDPCDHSTW